MQSNQYVTFVRDLAVPPMYRYMDIESGWSKAHQMGVLGWRKHERVAKLALRCTCRSLSLFAPGVIG